METTDPFGTRISFNLEVILAVVGLCSGECELMDHS